MRLTTQADRVQLVRMKRPAHVYIIAEDEAGPVKIGWTGGALALRLSMLQIGNPRLLLVQHSWLCHQARRVEAVTHARLHLLTLRGEWFSCTVAHAIEVITAVMAKLKVIDETNKQADQLSHMMRACHPLAPRRRAYPKRVV